MFTCNVNICVQPNERDLHVFFGGSSIKIRAETRKLVGINGNVTQSTD